MIFICMVVYLDSYEIIEVLSEIYIGSSFEAVNARTVL